MEVAVPVFVVDVGYVVAAFNFAFCWINANAMHHVVMSEAVLSFGGFFVAMDSIIYIPALRNMWLSCLW